MPAAEVLVLVPESSSRAPVDARSDVWGQSEMHGDHLRGQAAFFVAEVGVVRLDLDLELATDTFAVELRACEGSTTFSLARSRECGGVALSSTLSLGGAAPRDFPAVVEGACEAIQLLAEAVSVAGEAQRIAVVDAAARLRRALIRSAAGNLMAIDTGDHAWEAEASGAGEDLRRRGRGRGIEDGGAGRRLARAMRVGSA